MGDFKVVKNNDYYEIQFQESADYLLEFEQNPINQIENNEQIIKKKVDPKETFNKFYQEQNIISMYHTNPAGKGILETPAEKLNRLKLEIAEFKETMSFMNKQQEEQSKNINPNDVLSEIQVLENEVANVASVEEYQNLFNPEAKPYNLDGNVALLKKELQKSITENLKSQIQDISQAKDNSKTQSKIEVYLDQDSSKLSENSKYLELEQRINTIEETLGKGDLKKENFSGGASGSQKTGNGNLIQKVEQIESVLSILDDQKLNDVGKKIDNLCQDMEKINMDNNNSKNPTQQQQDKISSEDLRKISDLHEKLQSVQGISDELPVLVERLESLRYIHEESAGFMVNMSTLNDLHSKVVSQLGSNDELLVKLQGNFEKNLKVIETNIGNLDQRIQALEKQ